MENRKVKLPVNSSINISGDFTDNDIKYIEEKLEAYFNENNIDSQPIEKIGDQEWEITFWGEDIEVLFMSTFPISLGCKVPMDEEFKLLKLREKQTLIESGNAAIDENGTIVDAREYPDRPKIK